MAQDPLEKRQLLRGIIQVLAEPLPVDRRAAFVEKAVGKMNAVVPAPSRERMRAYLTRKISD